MGACVVTLWPHPESASLGAITLIVPKPLAAFSSAKSPSAPKPSSLVKSKGILFRSRNYTLIR
jgi:hypothetical protein